MKQLKLTGIFGAAVIALAFSVTSCKKSSSNNAPKLGTVSLNVNGKPVIVNDIMVDTSDLALLISGTCLLPGATDSASFEMSFFNSTSDFQQFKGLFADTSVNDFVTMDILDNQGDQWQNEGVKPTTINVTSNSGTVITGTFQGELNPTSGAVAQDSLIVTNGQFSVKIQ